MHLNDLAELLADHNGRIECSRDAAGFAKFRVELSDGKYGVQSVGGDLKSTLIGARDSLLKYIKNRDVVPISTHKKK